MPTMTYRPLATVTLGSTAASVTFSSIPATYRDLILVVAGTTTSAANLTTQVNGDTGNNYNTVEASATASGTQSFTNTSVDRFYAGTLQTTQFNNILQFMDYSATDKHKTILVRLNSTSTIIGMTAGRWANTAAINSINVFGATFNAGATFSLYGVIA